MLYILESDFYCANYEVKLQRKTLQYLCVYLSLIFNSLKKGGAVVIQVPNAQNLFGSRLRYGDFTHEIAFTEGSLYQLLRIAGFKEISFYPTGPVPKGIKSTVRFLLWKMIEIFLRFYMLVETGSGRGIYTQNIIAVARK